MNAHVLKWYRWQHFQAVRQGRQFAQCVWAKCYNDEVKAMTSSTETKEVAEEKASCNDHVEPVVSSELPHMPDVDEALSEAVAAIYFNDSSDYLPALWEVVKALGGESACELLEEDGSKAFHKYIK